MKKFVAVLSLFALAAGVANASPTFVGSWAVDDGPSWTTNPPVYSGQEAAALLFGGSPTDYLISVDPSLDPNSITGTSHYDGWAESDTIFAQDFHFDTGGAGYNSAPGVGSAWSSYVMDHSDGARNFAWRVNRDDVPPANNGAPVTPEPASFALLALGGIGTLLKKRLA